jgi:hypothetical protein
MNKLRKHSPSKALLNRADRALQDWFRANTDDKCVICGRKAELRHHHILKSKCNRLRYDERNLIPLCSRCHCLVHGSFRASSGQGYLLDEYILKKGKRWHDYLMRKQREPKLELTESYLKGIIEKYENTKNN